MELQTAIKSATSRLKKKKLGAFEVAGMIEESLVVEAKEGKVDSFRRATMRGIAVRVVKKGKKGWSATTDITSKAVSQAVDSAIDCMEQLSPTDEAVIPKAQGAPSKIDDPKGKDLRDIPDEEKIAFAFELEKAARDADARILKAPYPRYEDHIWTLAVENSEGISERAVRQIAFCQANAVTSDGKNSETGGDFEFSTRFEDLNASDVGVRAAKRALAKLGAERISADAMPVVFEPRAFASMLKLLAPSFFADNVQRGKSCLAGRRGEKVYGANVSLVDDGLLPKGIGSFPFDGEGVPKGRTMLVDGGVATGWLYDGARAAKDGVPSTGSCVRSDIKDLPSINVSNFFLKAGSKGPGEIMGGITRGLLVSDLMGLHMANPISGDFSLGAEGRLIENGELTKSVRGVTIAGNIHELFGKIGEVASDLKFFYNYGAPTVLVEKLMLGG